MKRKLFSFLFLGVFTMSPFAFTEDELPQGNTTPQPAAAGMPSPQQVGEAIAKYAAFIREVNNDESLTPDQRLEKVKAYMAAQNKKDKIGPEQTVGFVTR